jgi:hypothetical protein
MLLVMARHRAVASAAPVARTVRFPEALRAKIAADAERCGRSFEAHVIALLRRHFGENVDIAPPAEEIVSLASASVRGMADGDLARLGRRLRTSDGD